MSSKTKFQVGIATSILVGIIVFVSMFLGAKLWAVGSGDGSSTDNAIDGAPPSGYVQVSTGTYDKEKTGCSGDQGSDCKETITVYRYCCSQSSDDSTCLWYTQQL